MSSVQEDALPTARGIDVIFKETERLYNRVAHGCKLSDGAFWSLVSIALRDGRARQSDIADEYSFSRQTVNSAVKSLVGKGYVTLVPEEDDRRSKLVCLTGEGATFCKRFVTPAIEAEMRAFDSLSVEDRIAFARIARTYADAIDAELSALGLDDQKGGDAS